MAGETFDTNFTAVVSNNFFGDKETEAKSGCDFVAIFSPEIFVEDMRLMVFWDTDTVIGDTYM